MGNGQSLKCHETHQFGTIIVLYCTNQLKLQCHDYGKLDGSDVRSVRALKHEFLII